MCSLPDTKSIYSIYLTTRGAAGSELEMRDAISKSLTPCYMILLYDITNSILCLIHVCLFGCTVILLFESVKKN